MLSRKANEMQRSCLEKAWIEDNAIYLLFDRTNSIRFAFLLFLGASFCIVCFSFTFRAHRECFILLDCILLSLQY